MGDFQGIGDVMAKPRADRKPVIERDSVGRVTSIRIGNTVYDSFPRGFCPYGVCGGAGFLRYEVPVDDPRFGKVVPCQCKKDQAAGVISPEQLAQMKATVAPGYQARRLSDFLGEDEEALRTALNARHDKFGIYVWWSQTNGNGKTLILTSLVNEFQDDMGISAEYYTAQGLMNELHAAMANKTLPELLNKFKNIPVLAVDEFHNWSSSQWARPQFEDLMGYRYDRADEAGGLLTLIATNDEPDKGAVDRIESRLSDRSRTTVVHLTGPDMRPQLPPRYTADAPSASGNNKQNGFVAWRKNVSSAGNATDPIMQLGRGTGAARNTASAVRKDAPAPPDDETERDETPSGPHWSDDKTLCTLVLGTARGELKLEFHEIWQALGVENDLHQFAGTHGDAVTALRVYAENKRTAQ